MIGQTVSHYRILEKLGEGGMGVVYKAQDAKLDRIVALKFLPHHLTSAEHEQARFLQEAKAAATLNHPNVCTIYDIKEEDGKQFIVMEYVDGETLRAKIARSPLRLADAASYAIQIGEALQEAHGKGIVHRDIKADNIMVNSRNQIKVMDFGLAKLKGSLKLTRTSSTVGTLAYMAPEQIQGGEVDARSDVFSFGIVLYEMLTGQMPFRGEHEAAMMYSILNEEPDSLQKFLPEAPSELMHVFSRALEKDPEDRYQSVHDMVIDVRRLKKESTKVSRTSMPSMKMPIRAESESSMPASVEAPKPSAVPTTSVTINIPRFNSRWIVRATIALGIIGIAVVGYFFLIPGVGDNGERLPVAVADFVNQTGEKELDGLSGMLITSMEQSRRLSVLTRSHMFDILKRMGKNDVERIDEALGKEICSQANIAALVTASIRKFGKLYTIDLKVLDPQKNEYIFTAKEEAEGQESIPSMLDKLSEKTRIGLKEKATEVRTASANLANVTTSNMEAYQHFFQGEQFINRLKFDEAEKELRKAVELDSTFGLAWYRLAYTLSWTRTTGEKAREVLDKALLYIDRLPAKEQYLLRAVKVEQGGNFAQAVQILHEMEKTYPDDKEMIYNIGDWSYHAGDLKTASQYLERVLTQDPTFERALQHLTWTYRDLGQYEKMLDVAKRYVSTSGSSEAYGLLRDAYTSLGQFDVAIHAMQSGRELFPKRYGLTGSIANLYLRQGQYAKAEAESKSLLTENQPNEAKRIGYNNLMDLYFSVGRLRDALRTADEYIKLFWQEKDTSGALNVYFRKATAMVSLRKDTKDAVKEIEKTLPYRPDLRSQTKITLAVWYAYRGDFFAVDTLSRSNETANIIIRTIAHSNIHQCDSAAALVDTAYQRRYPPFAKVFALVPLARCQYEAGKLDQAITTVGKLHALVEALGTPQYVESLFLLGKIYDKKGERKLAAENYEKFLNIWKDADKDLPDYIEAKERLGKLKATATK